MNKKKRKTISKKKENLTSYNIDHVLAFLIYYMEKYYTYMPIH